MTGREIARFAPADPVEVVLEALERDGVAVIERLVDPSLCAAIAQAIQPVLDAIPFGFESFTGFRTKRMGAVASKVPAAHALITHPLVMALAHGFLRRFTDEICLNSGQFIVPYPGQKAQVLHRDRESWLHLPREVEPELNLIWAISPFDTRNGATRFALGSQHWAPDREATERDLVRAPMPVGSALVFSGSIIHGGGANDSESPRIGLGLSYCLAWIRAEENHFLSCPPEIAKHLTPQLQDLLGYKLMGGALGYYSDPHGATERAGLEPPEHALGRSLEAVPNPDVLRPLRLPGELDQTGLPA